MGFLGDHSFFVPKNVTAMGPFCQNLKDSIGCIQAYSRDCLQGFTRQLLASLLKRGKQQHGLICQDESSKLDFMDKMSCLTDDKIGQFHACMDGSIARFEFIRDRVRPERRLPSICCSYQIFYRDVDDTLDRVCRRAGAGDAANKFIHKIVGMTAGEFMSLVCDGHRSLDECRASDKTKDSLRQLEQVTKQVKQGKLAPKSKSLIPVLLDILDNSAPI